MEELKKFEEKYGCDSKFFFKNFKRGKIIINHKQDAFQWAFVYAITKGVKM